MFKRTHGRENERHRLHSFEQARSFLSNLSVERWTLDCRRRTAFRRASLCAQTTQTRSSGGRNLPTSRWAASCTARPFPRTGGSWRLAVCPTLRGAWDDASLADPAKVTLASSRLPYVGIRGRQSFFTTRGVGNQSPHPPLWLAFDSEAWGWLGKKIPFRGYPVIATPHVSW